MAGNGVIAEPNFINNCKVSGWAWRGHHFIHSKLTCNFWISALCVPDAISLRIVSFHPSAVLHISSCLPFYVTACILICKFVYLLSVRISQVFPLLIAVDWRQIEVLDDFAGPHVHRRNSTKAYAGWPWNNESGFCSIQVSLGLSGCSIFVSKVLCLRKQSNS